MREIAGVLLILAGLLGGLAVASHAGSILAGLQQWLVSSFGRAWFVPVAAAVALGSYMLWPRAPRPRLLDVLAGTIAVIALVGLFGLAAQAGGSAGRAIDNVVVGLAGTWGAWALLVAALAGLFVIRQFFIVHGGWRWDGRPREPQEAPSVHVVEEHDRSAT